MKVSVLRVVVFWMLFDPAIFIFLVPRVRRVRFPSPKRAMRYLAVGR